MAKPAADEIEISIFGPGYGECILLHSGDGVWIIVDSCVNGGKILPLEYLESIGVDVAQDVRAVIATHWHDDHVRGLSTIFKTCLSADFICSDALKSDEFLDLLSGYGYRFLTEAVTSGVSEFAKIATILKDRGKSPKWAIADRPILNIVCKNGRKFQLHSLSPSDTAVLISKIEFRQLLPQVKEAKRRVQSLKPNHTSVVLWAEWESASVLLGSDLEETGDDRLGWSAILLSETKPKGKASVYKVSHHGSRTGHHDGIWSNLMEIKPVSILTPFCKGNVILPTEPDIDRILSSSSSAFSTGRLRPVRPPRRVATVEKTIRESGIKLKPVPSCFGHIRLRRKLDGWEVTLKGDAVPLQTVYS
jgi:hypothetical protein